MALQIRRGLEADRTTITPSEGELLYTTDGKLVYIGDGTTAGGNLVSLPPGSGIAQVSDDASPSLGGNLDVNGYGITSSGGGNIVIDAAGQGSVILNQTLTVDFQGNISKNGDLILAPTTQVVIGRSDTQVDGNLAIVRNSYSSNSAAGFIFAQHHSSSADVTNFTFYRSRGTAISPTSVLNGDDLADISFIGWDGVGRAGGAAISATVEGVPTTGQIPTKLSFATSNGSALAVRAELSSAGTWKVNTLSAYSGSTMSVLSNVSIGNNFSLSVGDVRLSQNGLSTINSSADLTLTANSTGRVVIEGIFVSTNNIGTLGTSPINFSQIPRLPSFNDETAANAAIGGTPVNGMMFYDIGASVIKGYGNGTWHSLW